MDRSVQFVFNGFLNLSATQRQELLREVNQFYNDNQRVQASKAEEFRVVLGPLSSGCVCCGR
ncbi:hypothetical protein [Micromonospora sp. WMMD1082]|uniref:hypothetical protein n=1 Tax=Micromonospora sp. WMMD1082 TaxID=3016104 RepID=UPI0024167CEF|nr:hypothetical protein [Micromonospora sp. WMMD1082]MDG4794051.1 hypothetical protein [Micromonospora sp. WMMD1082]